MVCLFSRSGQSQGTGWAPGTKTEEVERMGVRLRLPLILSVVSVCFASKSTKITW